MYVFGGWIPVRGEELPTSSEQQAKPLWKCSNDLACFNLKTNEWEAFAFDPSQTGEQLPKSRAGHSAGKSTFYYIKNIFHHYSVCTLSSLHLVRPRRNPSHYELSNLLQWHVLFGNIAAFASRTSSTGTCYNERSWNSVGRSSDSNRILVANLQSSKCWCRDSR